MTNYFGQGKKSPMLAGARRIRAWRLRRQKLQSELAEELGVCQNTISRAELGLAIMRTSIDKFVARSAGFLRVRDFKEQSRTRNRHHGSARKAKRR